MNVNEAILRVLQSQNKRDNKEAFKIVEEAGLVIGKNKGYYIHNEQTGKLLKIKGSIWDCDRDFLEFEKEGGVTSKKVYRKDFDKVDLLSYLNSPRNKVYADMKRGEMYGGAFRVSTKYQLYRSKLRQCKSDIAYYERSIKEDKERFLKKIEDLTREYERQMDWYISRKKEQVDKLEEVRKEVGLK